MPVEDLKTGIENHYRGIFTMRGELDVLFEDLLKEIREGDLEKEVTYKNKKGEDLTKKFGHILMHLFNHKTHHRGEISAMLDIQKISNDYATMLNYL